MLTIRKSLIGALFSLFSFVCIDVFAQSADLIIQKTGPNQVYVGQYMEYTFTITNNGPNAVTNATWNDNLPSGMTNATFISCTSSGGAVCPSGGNISLTNTNFSGTIPSLPVNGQIIMKISMNAPAPANGTSFSNTATVSVPAGTTEVDPTTNSATFNTTLLTNTDIEVIKTATPSNIVCGDLPDTIQYTVTWINHGPSAANGVQLLDNILHDYGTFTGSGNATFTFPYDIFGETWYSSAGTSTPTTLFYQYGSTFNASTGNEYLGAFASNTIISSWEAGDTIRLTYSLAIQAPTIVGCGRSVSFPIRNNSGYYIPSGILLTDTNSSNNSAQVLTTIGVCTSAPCPTTDIEVIKTATPTSIACGDLPDTIQYTVTWINHGPSAADGVVLVDYILQEYATYTGSGNANFTFAYDIFGETWYSSAGTSTPTTLFYQYGPTFNSSSGNQYLGAFASNTIISSWEAGDTITLTYSLAIQAPTIVGCGRSVSLPIRNNSGYYIPSGILLTDTNSSNNSAQVLTTIGVCTSAPCPTTDIEVIKTATPTSIACGDLPDTIQYTVTWINHGPSAANGVQLLDNILQDYATFTGSGNANYTFAYDIFGETWYSSAGTSTPTTQFYQYGPTFNVSSGNQYLGTFASNTIISSWEAGDTITLTYSLAIQAPTIVGCGRSVSFPIKNNSGYYIPSGIQLTDTNSSNNSSVVSTNLSYTAIDLTISKNVSPVILNNNDTLTMTITLQNAPGGAPASTAVWLDTLPTTFTYLPSTLTCTPTGGAVCGSVSYNPTTRVLTQTNVNMPSNSQLVITLKGIVNSLYTITQYTRAYAIAPCVDCVPATNFTETNYQILGLCDTIKAGDDGFTTICDNSSSTIDLFSIITGEYGGGTWTRTSGTGGTFNAGAGTFTPSVGSTTSTFEYIIIGTSPCPNDTSVATIVINPTFNTSFDSTICSGSSVIVCGSTYTTAGTHVTTCQTVNGCDSTVTLNLTVNPTYNVTVDSTICNGQSVTICGTTYTTAGTHITTCQTVNGCDSIITLNLTINPVYNITIDSAICNGQSVTICGTTYTAAGTHVTTCQTVNGCDSIITLNLTINPVYNITIDSTICDGQSVSICGTTYTTAGTHVTTCQTVNGCDSIVTLNLTINPVYNITIDSTICDGQSVSICGTTYTTAGTHVTTCQTINGCDSTVTLNLTVNPTYDVTVDSTICNGQSVTICGTTYTTAGTHITTCQTVNGCDSIITLNLTINPVYNITIDSTICDGQSVSICGTTYTTAGTHVTTCQTVNGCDSIVTLNLTVNPTYNVTVDSTICDGESVTICGITYTTGGTHVTTCQTVDGCDSIITLNLTVNPLVSVSNIQTTCAPNGLSYTVSFDMSGTAPFTVTGGAGTVTGSSFTSDPITAGTGYNFNVTDANNCNTVNVSGNSPNCSCPPVFTTIDSTICEPNTVTICGNVHSSSGTYTDTCKNINGCDSIVTLNLTVNQIYNITINETTCDATQAGTTVQNLTTVNGCDSIVTTITTLLPSYKLTIDSTICAPNTVTICGNIHSSTGTYVDTCKTVDGCDSIITLNLTVNPLVSVSNIQTICAPNGLSYTVSFDMSGTAPFTVTGGAGTVTGSSFTSDPITAGTGYNFNVTDANNCNTVNVSGNSPNCSCPPVFTTIDSTICEPNTVTICGNVHSSSGTYTDTCKNITGCDSIVTLNLTVNQIYNITISETTCDATQAGTTVQNLTTLNGCDSIVTTITTLLPSYKLTIDSTICAPNTVTICGNIHSSTGTYVDTCKTVDGCDSIITLNLTVNPLVSVSNIQTTCAPNGLSYTVSFDMSGTAPFTVTGGAGTVTGSSFTSDPITAGTGYNFNVTDANNCNTVNVSGNSPNCSCPPVFTTIDSTICEPNTVTICGNVHSSSGTYTDTCKNINGCDSIVTLNLTVNQIYNITISETTCDATQAGTTVQNLTTVNGCDSIVTTITTLLPSYKLTIDSTICAPNTVTICGNIHSSTGTYVDTCKTVDGCDSIITLNLTVNPLVSVSNIQTTCAPNGLSYTVSFDMSGTAPFTVTGGAGTVTGSSFTSDPITAGTGYNFNVTDANNCNTVNVSGNSPNCSCPPVFTTIDSTICEPNTVTICGNVHSSTGTYTDTCKNINGCDSIVTLNLTVNQIYNITISETTCDATQAGTTVQNLTTVNGCDSIVTTITTLLPSYKLTIDSTICAPNTVTICGNIHSSTGTYVDTCKTVDGCDSIITLNLTVNPLVSVSNIQTTCAPNGLSYTVSFDMSGTAPFTVTGGAGTVTGSSFTSDPIARGVGYNFTVTDGGNCNSVNVSGVAPNCVIPCPTIDCGGVKVRKN